MPADAFSRVILVVDDDAAIRRVVKAFLEAAGYTVIIAMDGAAGLDCFMENQGEISLLLTDVVMPNMNGIDLADRVLEIDGSLPVLFMSGSTGNPDRGHGCVEKPFRASELLARIEGVLQRQAA